MSQLRHFLLIVWFVHSSGKDCNFFGVHGRCRKVEEGRRRDKKPAGEESALCLDLLSLFTQFISCPHNQSSQVAPVVKNPPANSGDIKDVGWIPGSRRSPGGGHGNPLQYSCLKNPMDRGAWQATVHRVAKSWTQLKQLSTA